MSDHKLVKIVTNLFNTAEDYKDEPSKNLLDSLNFWHMDTDWNEIGNRLGGVDWEILLAGKDHDAIYQIIINKITDICIEYLPAKKNKTKFFIPRDSKVLMRNKNYLRKKLSTTTSLVKMNNIKSEMKDIEEKLKSSHEAERIQDEQRAVGRIKENPKFFFKFAREKSLVRKPVGPLLSPEGEYVTEPSKMSEILKNQFESVYSVPFNSRNIQDLLKVPGPRCLEDLDFNNEDIAASIMTIKPKASAGPDAISAILLRKCAQELGKPLYMLWRASLDCGIVPQKMKLSKVVPIFKGGDKGDPSNYRPISLTSAKYLKK